jgi:DNA adenine methylase
MNVSPLRYPGGKTRACKKLDEIMKEYFDMSQFDQVVSPFFGGGSFEFYLHHQYQLKVIANDKFQPLYQFWKICKNDSQEMGNELVQWLNKVDKEVFLDMRKNILDETNPFHQACMYFIINRCSFSGATLSGGFSFESSKKRFTLSSIEKIKNLQLNDFTFTNLDFEECLLTTPSNSFLFLDPPYYLEKKSKLYGSNGDLHENFDHERLFQVISTKTNWMMTYNSCEYIKNLYKDFRIIQTNWSYGMNQTKKSSEIVIIG